MAHMYEEVKGRPSYVVESVLNPPEGAEIPSSATSSHPGRPTISSTNPQNRAP